MNFKNILKSILTYKPEEKYSFDLVEASYTDNKSYQDSSANELEQKKENFQKVFPSLSVNLDYIKTKYNLLINSDIVLREFTLNARGKQYNAFLIYIDGMIDSDIMNRFILEPLMLRNKNNLYDGSQSKVVSEAVTNNITVRKVKKFDLANYVMNCLMPQNTVEETSEFKKVISGVNSRKLWIVY